MLKFNPSQITIPSIALALAFMLPGAALADTLDNTPGGACVGSYDKILTVLSNGEVENRNSSTVFAICPAERPISVGKTNKLSGNVWVIDRHSTKNTCCRAVSKNPGGAQVSGSWACSSGSSTTYQILTIPQISDSYSWSHYFFQCLIPPKTTAASRIQMYRVRQES